MSVLMVRPQIKPEAVNEVEQHVRALFSALDEAAPNGVRYSSLRVDGSDTFVILLELEDPDKNPLPDIPAFREFQARLAGCLAEPPVAEQLTVVGSYRSY
jgi:hypothetical protein